MQRGLTSVSKVRLIKLDLSPHDQCDHLSLIGYKIVQGTGSLPHFKVNLLYKWSVLPETPFENKFMVIVKRF